MHADTPHFASFKPAVFLVFSFGIGLFLAPVFAQDSDTPPPVPQRHLAPPDQSPDGVHRPDRQNPDNHVDRTDPHVMPSIGDILQPDFSRRDLPTFTSDLKLDDNQQQLVLSLLQDYQEAFTDGAKVVQLAFSELRPVVDRNHDRENRDRGEADIDDEMRDIADEMDHIRDHMSDNPDSKDEDESQLNELDKRLTKLRADRAAVYSPDTLTGEQFQASVNNASQALQAWQSRRAALRTQFITDVQTVLSDSQKPLWPALERKFTREKTLSRGTLQGESVNLFSLIDELKFPADVRSPLASDLNAYDLSLDSALTQRNQYVDSSRTDLWLAFQSRDLPKAASIDSRESDLHVAVRNVNDSFAAGIASKLPMEQQSQTFLSAFHARAYPRVFRSTATERIFKTAKELPDLSPETLKSVTDLQSALLAELAPVNLHLIELTRTSEPRESGSRIAARLAPDSDLDLDPAIQETRQVFEERDAIGHKYLNQLKSLLTPEQFDQLPGANQIDAPRHFRTFRPGSEPPRHSPDHEPSDSSDQ